MEIGLTGPLRRFLRMGDAPLVSEDDLFYCWDAHRLALSGGDVLVLTNSSTRLTGIRAMSRVEWGAASGKVKGGAALGAGAPAEAPGPLERAVLETARFAMELAGVPAEAQERYLERAGAVRFSRTHGRRALGNMNAMIAAVLGDDPDWGETFQVGMSLHANELLGHCAGHDGTGFPAEWFARDLRAHGCL